MGGESLATLLFHKPYGVLSQFTPEPRSRWASLASYIDCPGVYPAGRLDADSEGLLLLTDHGRLQSRLTDPRWGHRRRYLAQVEGEPTPEALQRLRQGIPIAGRLTLPAGAIRIDDPDLGPRTPPIRERRSIPTAWIQLELREGRNRQVRRMTAAVGFPTLRLVRVGIDLMDGGPALGLQGLEPGDWRPATTVEHQRLMSLLIGSPRKTSGLSRSPR